MGDTTISTAIPDLELERRTVHRVVRRLVPFLGLLFIFNFLDRTNVGFAALTMNGDIGITASLYGFGAGIFFIGYFLFEVPSNVMLHKFGPRIWIARIMITWGLISTSMGFLHTPAQFIGLRLLLGLAEAGFFPGIIFLLGRWIPRRYLAGTIAMFYLGAPVSQVIGAPLSTALMTLGARVHFAGWRLMYVCEGIPAVLLGLVCLAFLTDAPSDARWLAADERAWLVSTLAAEEREKAREKQAAPAPKGHNFELVKRALSNGRVWLLALIYFSITIGSNSINYLLPSVLASFRNSFGVKIGLVTNGILTAIPYAAAAVAMLLWTRHSDRTQERRKHTGAAVLIAATAIAVSLLINKPTVIVIGFVLLAAGVYSALNVFWSIPQQILTGLEAAAGIALINSIGNLSGFFGPYIASFLYDITGRYNAGFYFIAAVAAAGGITILFMKDPQHNGR